MNARPEHRGRAWQEGAAQAERRAERADQEVEHAGRDAAAERRDSEAADHPGDGHSDTADQTDESLGVWNCAPKPPSVLVRAKAAAGARNSGKVHRMRG